MQFIKTALRLFFIVSAFLLSACGGGGGGGGGNSNSNSNNPTVTQMDTYTPVLAANIGINLGAAKGLALAKGDIEVADLRLKIIDRFFDLIGIKTAYAQTSNKDFLFQLDNTGKLSIVNVLNRVNDTTGEVTEYTVASQMQTNSGAQITGITDIGDYIALGFSGLKNNSRDCLLVLVKKANGNMICLPISGASYFTPVSSNDISYHSSNIQSNSNGNLIFIGGFGIGLKKIDISDPQNPIETTLIDYGVDPYVDGDFSVNSAGDVLLSVSDRITYDHYLRVYKVSGGYQTITLPYSSAFANCYTNGIGVDSLNFYYMPSYAGKLQKLTKNNGAFLDTFYAADNNYGYGGCSNIVKIQNKIYQSYSTGTGINTNIFNETVNSSSSAVQIAVSAFTKVVKIWGAGSTILIYGTDNSGNGGFVRYNVATTSQVTIVQPGDYSIGKVSVSPAGEVTFTGRRSSDNVRIIGTIAAGSNQVTINAQNLSTDVSALLRLR